MIGLGRRHLSQVHDILSLNGFQQLVRPRHYYGLPEATFMHRAAKGSKVRSDDMDALTSNA